MTHRFSSFIKALLLSKPPFLGPLKWPNKRAKHDPNTPLKTQDKIIYKIAFGIGFGNGLNTLLKIKHKPACALLSMFRQDQ